MLMNYKRICTSETDVTSCQLYSKTFFEKGENMCISYITQVRKRFSFFLMFIFEREREREREREQVSMSGGGAEREGDTESKAGSRLQATSCQHRARRGA